MNATNLGLMHFWQAGDAVTHSVAWALLVMSVLSWMVILAKVWMAWGALRSVRQAVDAFWSAPSVKHAARALHEHDRRGLIAPMVEAARSAVAPIEGSLDASARADERLTRALRQALRRIRVRLESGQTLLASVGSTAPFVGLFGTVWGIYHALLAIAGSGQVQIDRVAGPVGEALIMTAAGLAVAIPAVLAYNAFTRVNRVVLAEIDGFAHDLSLLDWPSETTPGRAPATAPAQA